MTTLLLSWPALAFSLWLAGKVVPGVRIGGPLDAVVVAALFGALHFLLGWVMFWAIGLGTLGIGLLFAFLTRWLVDAILLKLADALTDRLTIRGFLPAVWTALLAAAVGTGVELLTR